MYRKLMHLILIGMLLIIAVNSGGCSDCRSSSTSARQTELMLKNFLFTNGTATNSNITKNNSGMIDNLEKASAGKWLPTNGPVGGVVNVLAVSSTGGSNYIFAGTFDGEFSYRQIKGLVGMKVIRA